MIIVDTIRKKLFELQKRYYVLPPEADLTETDETIEKMESSWKKWRQNLSVDSFNNCSSLIEYATSTLLKTLVSNRVAKIQSLCSNSQWRHVSSKINPAEVLSRDADARDLRDNDLWWQGPEFFLRDIPDPEWCPCPKEKTFEKELKRTVTVSCAVTNDYDFLINF
ncbi:hypothetical protein AVEN_227592-1 [Araneus ventricosus]|uniref:Uncharacterized protein n=1 Tax=Araneus ventricosus TaxID=182803 RepID=A0A4Y2K8Q2_ARAVE|nr:hypothetical protein AVEN_227592-1 [Araneus ventricosus]